MSPISMSHHPNGTVHIPLISHVFNGCVRWTDEDQPSLGTFSRKSRVFTQLIILSVSSRYSSQGPRSTYKAISGMYSLTPFFLRNFNNSVTIKIRRYRSEIKSKWRAQGMLCSAIRIGVKGSHADAAIRSCASNAPEILAMNSRYPRSSHTERFRHD